MVLVRRKLNRWSKRAEAKPPDTPDRVGTLPLHHRDPFDRLLIAEAGTQMV